MDHKLKNKTVCIAGLGYVGLPLALAFSGHLKTIVSDVKFFEKKFSKTIRHSAPLQSDYRSRERGDGVESRTSLYISCRIT